MMLVGWGAEAAGRRQLRELARMGGHFADRLKGLGLLRLYGRGDDELRGIAEAAEGVRERTPESAAHRVSVLHRPGVLRLGQRGDRRALPGPELPRHDRPAR